MSVLRNSLLRLRVPQIGRPNSSTQELWRRGGRPRGSGGYGHQESRARHRRRTACACAQPLKAHSWDVLPLSRCATWPVSSDDKVAAMSEEVRPAEPSTPLEEALHGQHDPRLPLARTRAFFWGDSRMQRHRRRRATRPRGFPNSQKSPRRAHAGTFVPIPRRRWTPKAAPEDQHLP